MCDRHPFLYSVQMYAAWLSGDAEAAEYYLDKLISYLPVIAEKYPEVLETTILQISLDHRKTFNRLIAGFAKLPPIPAVAKGFQGASLTIHLPFVHRCLRDYSELADEGAMEQLDYAFGLLLKDLYRVVRPCLQSGILREQNRLDEALSCAVQAKEAAADIQSPELVFSAYSHLCAAYYALGNETLLKQTLAETEHYLEQSGARYLDHNFLALKAKIRLMDADKKAAQDWLDNYFVTEEERVPLYKNFQYFTTARTYIALNQGGKAMGVIRRLIQFAKDYRRPLDLAEAQTLKACIDWAEGNRAEATAGLEETLLGLHGRGFIRIVADEGAAIVPVLKRITSALPEESGLDRAYVTEVLLAAHATAKQRRGVTANMKKSGKPVKLAKQQKRMLELLAQGYKNQDIADMEDITLNTVKWHLKQVYDKLGVHNSMDALLKARELGLM
jgi:LuxR family maltose regulon positive regulatory protein